MLVPLAWTLVTAAHLGIVREDTLFAAHVVMSVLLAGFVFTGRADMQEGVLDAWWHIVAVGLLATLSGTAGFVVESARTALLAVALVGWMVLPAAGFVFTGRRVTDGTWIYFGGAAGCVLGAMLYAAGVLAPLDSATIAGLVLVGIGQTAGILDAALRY